MIATTNANDAPTAVKPYAQNTRAQGHVNGFRQSRPKESSSSLRKSSVIGFGSTALHSSHMNHPATPSSIIPKSAVNARFIAPPRYTIRSHGKVTGGGP